MQVAGSLRLVTQTLHAAHDIVGLGEEGITQALYPDRVLAKGRQHLRDCHHGLDARVPGLRG